MDIINIYKSFQWAWDPRKHYWSSKATPRNPLKNHLRTLKSKRRRRNSKYNKKAKKKMTMYKKTKEKLKHRNHLTSWKRKEWSKSIKIRLKYQTKNLESSFIKICRSRQITTICLKLVRKFRRAIDRCLLLKFIRVIYES